MMVGQVDEGIAAFEAAIDAADARPDAEAELLARGALGVGPRAARRSRRGLRHRRHGRRAQGRRARPRRQRAAGRLRPGLAPAGPGGRRRGGAGRDGGPAAARAASSGRSRLCALALVAAADGRGRRRGRASPGGCRCTRRPPTSTRPSAEIAAGLALARDRRRGAARPTGSTRPGTRVDATGDRLFQAVVRVADATALGALGDPGGRRPPAPMPTRGWRASASRPTAGAAPSPTQRPSGRPPSRLQRYLLGCGVTRR